MKLVQSNSMAFTSTFLMPVFNFYHSLVNIALFFDTVQKPQLLLKEIVNNQNKMKQWADYAPMNYSHKYYLVEAEKHRVLGHELKAMDLYDRAISLAKEHEYLNEEALANELAAKFYLSREQEKIAKTYMKEAHYCYQKWGATAKVKHLERTYPQLFSSTSEKNAAVFSPTTSTSGNDSSLLDIKSILAASQVISSEIVLEQLLEKLMKVLIENAGAQKGFLIMQKKDNWVIQAEGSVDSQQVTIGQSIPINARAPESSVPLLPTTIINYVLRAQKNLLLDNAAVEGQFTRDPYVLSHQSKSIFCLPLLHQGRLIALLYLENNLTAGAFTTDRTEVLNILSSQAAISLQNAELYDTLEQKVSERTQELSQTVEVLKATQAELQIENALLRSDSQPLSFDYQVGGSLPMYAPTYVVRSADRQLYQALKACQLCYILNARQMGKSSLMVQMIQRLNKEGYYCVAIDMTSLGNENITPEKWYKGLAVELWRSFDLVETVNLKSWWQERQDLPLAQRLRQFIEEVLLVEVRGQDETTVPQLIIFFDEIDSVLGLNFPVNDFFALIRFCYNQRSLDREYRRLTFAFFGAASPSDLITDYQRTPFNLGRAINLEGFKEHEAQPLLQGLSDKISNPQTVLKEVLAWTGGQPFLTQKLCKFIRDSEEDIPNNQEAEWIENLVITKIISNWESQDEPEHLRTIRERILHSDRQPTRLLELYREILVQATVKALDSREERELLLSGLVVKQQGFLKVGNRIYQLIFDRTWVELNLGRLRLP